MISRRQVLRGALGGTLALPILPSLFDKDAMAKGPLRPPRLLWIATNHGGAQEASMFPSSTLLTMQQNVPGAHTVAAGALKATLQGNNRVVSPILSAPSSALTDTLLGKMNVLRGLDIPFYIAHHTGGHLGNYARNDGNGGDGMAVQAFPRPTIDQIAAWSPSFYTDLSSVKERVMVMGGRALSYNWSSPQTHSGTIDNQKGYTSSKQLFGAIFVPPTTPTRAPIVDQVLGSYKSLRNGNARLSAADKQRLDDHMARMDELERKINAKANCGSVMPPSDEANQHMKSLTTAEAVAYVDLFTDVAVAAFICGTSRIGVIGCSWSDEALGNYSGDWHQDVAHQWQIDAKQQLIANAYQSVFAKVMLPLAAKLDAVTDGFGTSILDDTLVVWSQECGVATHDSYSIPIVTFGSAAGALKTGLYCDYRNATSPYKIDVTGGQQTTLGLLYNQWLATVLNSMGVPPSDYELWGHKGYGVPYLSKEFRMRTLQAHRCPPRSPSRLPAAADPDVQPADSSPALRAASPSLLDSTTFTLWIERIANKEPYRGMHPRSSAPFSPFFRARRRARRCSSERAFASARPTTTIWSCPTRASRDTTARSREALPAFGFAISARRTERSSTACTSSMRSCAPARRSRSAPSTSRSRTPLLRSTCSRANAPDSVSPSERASRCGRSSA